MATIAVAALNPEDPALVAAVAGPGVELLPLQDLDTRLRAGGVSGIVVVSDDVDSDLAVLIAGMLGNGAPPAIEVHSDRWDGFHHSLLSEACREVISGFGVRGVVAAIQLLTDEAS